MGEPRERSRHAALTVALLFIGLSGCRSARRTPGPGELGRPVPGELGPPEPEDAITDEPLEGPAGGDRGPAPTPLLGGCGPAPLELRPKYVLPFPVGGSFPLTQGNCGGVSHAGRFSFAFDFRMPIGTPLIATRDGTVFAAQEGRPDGTRRSGDENYVFIRHEDGEISRYIHLTTEGVLVEPGDVVRRGDTIALSGNSGPSTFPHLHFDVARGCGSAECITVSAAFLNVEPAIPLELAAYTAGPYPEER